MGYYDPVYLRPHHKQAIRLRLQGYSHERIGRFIGMHPKAVSKLLNSKKPRQLIQEYEQELDKALKEKFGKSTLAKINGLKGEDGRLDLDKAFSVFESALEVSWTKKHARRKRRTGEDFVREIMDQGAG